MDRNNSFSCVLFEIPVSESCTVDQMCLGKEEGDNQSEDNNSGDIISRLLHLTGHTPPHRIHQ